MIATTPTPSARLLSVACYLGLAPLVRWLHFPSSDRFFRHHYAQAMAACFLLPLVFLLCSPFEVGLIVLVHFPEFKEQTMRWSSYLEYGELVLLAALLILWITLLGLAIAGSERQVPLLKQLARRTWVIRFSLIGNSLALALAPLIVVLTFHASSLTRASNTGGAVHFLYDEGIPVPRWGYAVFMYRLSLQAERNWGRESIVLDRLNKETLRTALAHGKVVILATHGGDGYATTYYAPETLWVRPPASGAKNELNHSRFLQMCALPYTWKNLERMKADKWEKWENVNVNSDLRLFYVFGCDAGKKASQWEEHLAPAQVITYNRLSTVVDHAHWFALTGPAQLEKVP